VTIDTVSCIILIIGIGLCVDYSVHIAHWFMTESGKAQTTAQRIETTLTKIGPAVANGGVSTFLVPILPNAFFPILHIFVRFSHKYVFNFFYKFVKNESFQMFMNICKPNLASCIIRNN
jgi:hypothetical protein